MSAGEGRRVGLFVDGVERDAVSGESFDVFAPETGEVGRVSICRKCRFGGVLIRRHLEQIQAFEGAVPWRQRPQADPLHDQHARRGFGQRAQGFVQRPVMHRVAREQGKGSLQVDAASER